MKKIVFIFWSIFICFSCATKKPYKDIGIRYFLEDKPDKSAYIYRSTETGKKIDGKTIFIGKNSNENRYNFRHYTTFIKGIQTGKDSIFRNDTLVCVNNYLGGQLHGEQIQFYDSTKVLSNYKDGFIHGEEIEFSDNVILRKTLYQFGIKSEFEYTYNKNGELVKSVEYRLDTNKLKIPFQQMNKVNLEMNDGVWDSAYEYLTKRNFEFKGIIQVFSSNNSMVWIDEIIHPSEVNLHFTDDFVNGRYYIIELWGGDGIDQIWKDTWLARKARFDSKYEFIELEINSR